MKRFRTITAIAAAITLAPGGLVAQEQFEGTITFAAQLMGMSVDMVHHVKENRIRQEMTMPMGEMVMIIDMGTMEANMIMPAQRTYMKIDLNQFAGAAAAADPTVTRTGETDSVIGHDCEYVDIGSSAGTVNMCVATDLGYYFMGGGSGGGMGAGPGMNEKVEALIREEFSDGFFPLKISMVQAGQNVVMEATSIERKAVSEDLFVIPEGYTETAGMGGRGGGIR